MAPNNVDPDWAPYSDGNWFGNLIMDGRGSETSRGDGRHITTGAGSATAARGDVAG